MISIPDTKLASIPAKNSALNVKSFMESNTAAATIGAESRNEYLAALSLSTHIARAVVIVIPERDTPGIAAASA